MLQARRGPKHRRHFERPGETRALGVAKPSSSEHTRYRLFHRPAGLPSRTGRSCHLRSPPLRTGSHWLQRREDSSPRWYMVLVAARLYSGYCCPCTRTRRSRSQRSGWYLGQWFPRRGAHRLRRAWERCLIRAGRGCNPDASLRRRENKEIQSVAAGDPLAVCAKGPGEVLRLGNALPSRAGA